MTTALLASLLTLFGNWPSTNSLSGLAFMQVFEAKEERMPWLLLGMILAIAGLLAGVWHMRSWAGKCSMAVGLFGAIGIQEWTFNNYSRR